MLKKICTLQILLLLATAPMLLAADIEISDIATKLVSSPDSSGDVYYAIKADVTNNGQKQDVRVELQAVDSDGFEVADLTLRGDIPPGTSKVLTDKKYMQETAYKSIKNWQIKN